MLFGAEGIFFLALMIFWIWALIDTISADEADCRNLPKLAWVLLVLFLLDIGAIAWVLAGRPVDRRRVARQPQGRRHVAYEDSSQYTREYNITDRRSAELDAQLAEWEQRQAELRRRDEDDPSR